MRLSEFIRQNRQMIDDAINKIIYRYDGKGGKGTIPNPAPKYNDETRRQWILTDEYLYRAAQRGGCKI